MEGSEIQTMACSRASFVLDSSTGQVTLGEIAHQGSFYNVEI